MAPRRDWQSVGLLRCLCTVLQTNDLAEKRAFPCILLSRFGLRVIIIFLLVDIVYQLVKDTSEEAEIGYV